MHAPQLSIVAILAACTAVSPTAAAATPVDFDADILPLLSDRCFRCHGPAADNREADLRLDEEAAAKDYVIVPGEPDESELYRRIASDDPEERMPPRASKLELSDAEIELIRHWIEAGASWQQHWAFVPPQRPPVPTMNDTHWSRNDIDHFILKRLEEHALRPSPEATPETLIRRLAFDLTGLPPTLREIDDYLADDSPEAYEKLVDRLLSSPRYGERMATDWLDVARYSDTFGYQVDRDRFVWPYRDWVLRAFNSNLPYDQFVTQQLAGDLLPQPESDQFLATTFCRLHPQKVEGGSVPEEFRVEYVADRTQTFATAFLGLTMECCRCHDHKYDPLTQKEYYQLSAFFDNIDEAGLYSYFTDSVPTPTLLLPTVAQGQAKAAIEASVAAAEQQLADVAAGRHAEFHEWLAAQRGTRETPIPGRAAHLAFEQPPEPPNRSVPGQIGNAVQLTGDDGIALEVGNFRRFEPFSIALWINTPDEKERAVIYHRSRAWTDAGSRGYELLFEKGRLQAALIHFWPGNALAVKTLARIEPRNWHHVAVTYDGSSRAAGLRLFVNGAPTACEIVRDNLQKNITGGGGDNITIGERFRDRGFAGGLVDEFQVFSRELTPWEVTQLYDPQRAAQSLQWPHPQQPTAVYEALYQYYLATQDAAYRRQLAALRAVREERSNIVDPIAEIMCMRELDEPRATYVRLRGAYDNPGEVVPPAVPATLSAWPYESPPNRLGLADWLTRPENPLTARVFVNRVWQMLFGAGIVRTPEDFGRQGQPPTHPQLLDWLACDFMAHDWDVKRLIKQIVMSATYRQCSTPTSGQLASDPENRWCGRGPSDRLPAEMLRDLALAASGLLVERLGGPPARPYEVEKSFQPVPRDQGDGLYRRSLYTYWKRTGPAPVMTTLDAGLRDVCRVRRERTSTPLQALVLMNSPQFVEASRVLAHRLLREHEADQAAVLVDLFRNLTARRPEDEEYAIIHRLYEEQLVYFAAHPAAQEEYLRVGDAPLPDDVDHRRLAATAVVANALLSFDEVQMKR